MNPPRAVKKLSLGARIFLGQVLVLAASVVTALVVASLIGPPLFHAHLLEIGLDPGSQELEHIERAFTDAGITSLGIGLALALTLALAVAWRVTNRLRRPLEDLTRAANKVSAGDYTARVSVSGPTPELDSVGEAFNDMAGRLDKTEATRRRLLSDVAHEVRTPIATLRAVLEAIADGITPWDEDARRLLVLQTERLQRIASDLDEVSRAEEGRLSLDPEPVDMADCVRHAVAAARPKYAVKGVELQVTADPVRLVADPQRVDQIMQNLLLNALRHTPGGGRVSVTARKVDDTAVVTVTDTGDGLSADQLDRVFERFYRADSARSRDEAGAGIGLTISRSLAAAHGGTLTASSPGPGEGSTFTLVLPIEPRLEGHPTTEPPAAS